VFRWLALTLLVHVVAGMTVRPHGIQQIDIAAQAANALEPLAGPAARQVFAAGAIGVGFLGSGHDHRSGLRCRPWR